MRAFIVVVLLLLTGCTVNLGSPEEEPTSAVVSADERYLEAVREEAPFFDESPDADMIELGHTICESYDLGMTSLQIAEGMVDDPAYVPSTEEMGALLVAALTAYCPNHIPDAVE